jgi:hypothetical protein
MRLSDTVLAVAAQDGAMHLGLSCDELSQRGFDRQSSEERRFSICDTKGLRSFSLHMQCAPSKEPATKRAGLSTLYAA